MFDLNWLMYPFDKKIFFNDIWQKEPKVLATEREGYFELLFGGKALENILEFSQPQPPSIRLASANSSEKMQVPFSPNGRLDLDKLRKHYLNGQTTILNSVEDFDPAVAQLTRSIECDMGARVQVNSYLTPASAQGFHPHYDTHDVLVAQIEGEKKWRIYGADSVCPLQDMTDGDPKLRESAQPPEEIYLRPGDLLYIPRGWIHEAETNKQPSLHLTLGIHPPLGKDLLSSALEVLVNRHPELRETLPVGPLCDDTRRKALTERFAALVKLFTKNATFTDAANSIDDNLLRRGRSGGDGHLFGDPNVLGDLSGETKLERRSNVPSRLVKSDDSVALQFLNGLVTGPLEFEQAMLFIKDQDKPFSIGELPGLEPDHQIALGISLVSDGLCRIIEND